MVAALSGAARRAGTWPVTLADRALCIYTSGTTGLPKAANVSHHRIMSWSHWFAGMMDMQAHRPACTIAFRSIHSIGGDCRLGGAARQRRVGRRQRKIFRQRFLAGDSGTRVHHLPVYWRALPLSPESALSAAEQQHIACAFAAATGLRGDIWQTFQNRFHIPHILEFYAATEANFSLYNVDEQPGSIGRIPSFLAHRLPIQLIKVDAGTLEPFRDGKELCVPAATGEPGEAVFKIAADANAGAASFEGYTSARETDKKTLRGVKAKDDVWYRSGDLMRRDGKGFFYFAGRLGDTFRWKGENVSTQEVAQTIAAFPGVLEAAVYGVAVPNADGRAGMAALSIDGAFDLKAFKAYLDGRLPRYAQPLFLRIVNQLDLTSTFRPQKGGFASQGAIPATVPDPLYFNDEASGGFVKLDASLYEAIAAGRVRL